MTREEIKNAITEQILLIAPDIEESEIVPDENLQRSLEIDSFDFLKVLTALNEQLGVEVPESDYGKVDTLEHMANYFAERL
ncbi:MAG: phosphopantetheine-binding protein [Campylobacterota bacterium]|nr:phosphopantetheine-binding protein [Campylobacterota bacterium]